jgi:hypothetical protein
MGEMLKFLLAAMETETASHIFIGWIFCQQGDPETDRKALVKNVFAAAAV